MKQSAGLLLYRKTAHTLEVLLVHPGSPFWAKKDKGAWSLPKGEYGDGEQPLAAAKREFSEETGAVAPEGEYVPLGEAKLSNKIIHAWAVEGDFDLANFKSNTFEIEWPPKSGARQTFPEADRAQWFPMNVAMVKVHKGQLVLLEALSKLQGAAANSPQIALF